MSEAAPAGATYQDVLDAPPNKVAEMVEGQLQLSPRPASPHARSASALGMDLGNPFDRGRGGPGGWWILHEPELHFGANVLVPDLGGWRRERMPRIANTPYFKLAPDWVCEVISPTTARFDRIKKVPLYAAHGVSYCWLVDPLQRTLEILELKGDSYSLVQALGEEDLVRARPFDAIELELSGLWLDESETPIPGR